MNPEITAGMMRFWTSEFGHLQTERHLRELLEVEATEWLYLTERASYREYTIPKRNGGFRLIEDPEPALKNVLRRLNPYLQAVYHSVRSGAAYGFMLCPDQDPEPRNILTNARRHCGRAYLLNADFLDFFHAVSQTSLQRLFEREPFDFPEELSGALARLCCRKGRLPIGSPTSPVLSNFAARPLDAALFQLARHHQWHYTRFADDLSFSSDAVIGPAHVREVRQCCLVEGFRFNERKVVVYGPGDDKYVTGLLVNDSVEVPADFLENLHAEITKLQTVLEIKFRTGQYQSGWVERFRQQIEGHLRFARFVLGSQHPDYQHLLHQYEAAQKPLGPEYGPASWLDFNSYC